MDWFIWCVCHRWTAPSCILSIALSLSSARKAILLLNRVPVALCSASPGRTAFNATRSRPTIGLNMELAPKTNFHTKWKETLLVNKNLTNKSNKKTYFAL